MRIITGFVFIANIALWILGIIVGFAAMGGVIGFPVIIGLIAFLISWRISGDFATSPADYFFQPEWDVFKTKLKWSNGIGVTSAFVAAGIIIAIVGGL